MNVGRPHIQAGDIAVVFDVLLLGRQRDIEVGQHEFLLDFALRRRIQQGDLQEVVRIEHLARDTDLLRHQASCGDAAALAIAAVLHLDRRLVNELATHGNVAGKPGDAAATFFGAGSAIGILGLALAIHL